MREHGVGADTCWREASRGGTQCQDMLSGTIWGQVEWRMIQGLGVSCAQGLLVGVVMPIAQHGGDHSDRGVGVGALMSLINGII